MAPEREELVQENEGFIACLNMTAPQVSARKKGNNLWFGQTQRAELMS
jgi:hypothetical protein